MSLKSLSEYSQISQISREHWCARNESRDLHKAYLGHKVSWTDMKPSFCYLLKTIQILPSVIITQSELYLNTALVRDWTCERVTVRFDVFLGAAVGQGRFKLSQEHRAYHGFLCVDGDHSVRIIQGHRHQDQTTRTHRLTGKPGNTHKTMDFWHHVSFLGYFHGN